MVKITVRGTENYFVIAMKRSVGKSTSVFQSVWVADSKAFKTAFVKGMVTEKKKTAGDSDVFKARTVGECIAAYRLE